MGKHTGEVFEIFVCFRQGGGTCEDALFQRVVGRLGGLLHPLASGVGISTGFVLSL
jgi:hypothetical protein